MTSNYRASEIRRIVKLVFFNRKNHEIYFRFLQFCSVFPNLAATQLILTCGNHWINVDAVDITNGNTALHIVSEGSKKPMHCQLLNY